MNKIYLITTNYTTDDGITHYYYKIGFTTNIIGRLIHYDTHIPFYKFVDIKDTMKKCKHRKEREMQLKALCKTKGDVVYGCFSGTMTEWVEVNVDNYKNINKYGFGYFK